VKVHFHEVVMTDSSRHSLGLSLIPISIHKREFYILLLLEHVYLAQYCCYSFPLFYESSRTHHSPSSNMIAWRIWNNMRHYRQGEDAYSP
jgi:hypothetical protein